MKIAVSFPLLLFSLVLLTTCRKDKLKSELAHLPPITQSGANRFGCLVNGKAWTPNGFFGNIYNFTVTVDPFFQNGNFDLRAYRFENDKIERIVIFSNDVRNAGVFPITPSGDVALDFKSQVRNCYFLHSLNNYTSGFLKITRYDLQYGIVSGEFECTLYDKTTQCDTIKITHGRFDYKLY